MNVLEVYLAKHCLGYEEVLRLTEEIEQSFSGIEVKVIMLDDLAEGDLPDIPATPSYFLNDSLRFSCIFLFCHKLILLIYFNEI